MARDLVGLRQRLQFGQRPSVPVGHHAGDREAADGYTAGHDL
jgi:hypothetical protein